MKRRQIRGNSEGKDAINTGDYTMSNDGQRSSGEVSAGKMLFEVGEHRKKWVRDVTALVEGGTMTEVLKCALDQAAVEDPESYAVRVSKWRTENAIKEIERQEIELAEKKARLLNSISPSDGAAARLE